MNAETPHPGSLGDTRWAGISALAEPCRRALYQHVRRAGHPTTREEAADATGISRGLAAFHLDKLVEAGLLTARYESPADQPRGRGRSPKVYLPAGDGIAITVPERRYELIAEILADGVADGGDAADAARRHAYERGAAYGRSYPGDLADLLADLGFEPDAHNGIVVLRNCPFHALTARHPGLVCGLNLAFLTGLADAAGGATAHLAPRPDACCVEIHMDATP